MMAAWKDWSLDELVMMLLLPYHIVCPTPLLSGLSTRWI